MIEEHKIRQGLRAYLERVVSEDASEEEVQWHKKLFRRHYQLYYKRQLRSKLKEITIKLTPKAYATIHAQANRNGISVTKQVQNMIGQSQHRIAIPKAIDCESTLIAILNEIESAYLRGQMHGGIYQQLNQHLLALRKQIQEATQAP